jgi:glycosyltransferase involved in cell wall biosynthesis
VKRRILYIQYTSPSAYPPLEHSAQLLVDAGWQVLFLGVSKEADPPLHWAARDGITVRELSPGGSGWLRKVHYIRFMLWVLTWIVRWRPRWIYASDVLASPVALVLSNLLGAHVIYHEHDRPQLSGHTRVAELMLRTRRTLARRAAARILPNAERAREFVATVGNHRPTFSVWNCPLTTEISERRAAASGEGLEVLYIGSIVRVRLPASVIDALALLPETVRLSVIGYATGGDRAYIRDLQRRALQAGVERRVTFLEAMPHADLLVRSRTADVGLALISVGNDPQYSQWMPGASNKPFDYLASGLALLVPDEAGWREMYVAPGYGLACQPDDPRSIAQALRWFLEHPTELRAMGELGRQRIAHDWNYETQFRPVLAGLERACA